MKQLILFLCLLFYISSTFAQWTKEEKADEKIIHFREDSTWVADSLLKVQAEEYAILRRLIEPFLGVWVSGRFRLFFFDDGSYLFLDGQKKRSGMWHLALEEGYLYTYWKDGTHEKCYKIAENKNTLTQAKLVFRRE